MQAAVPAETTVVGEEEVGEIELPKEAEAQMELLKLEAKYLREQEVALWMTNQRLGIEESRQKKVRDALAPPAATPTKPSGPMTTAALQKPKTPPSSDDLFAPDPKKKQPARPSAPQQATKEGMVTLTKKGATGGTAKPKIVKVQESELMKRARAFLPRMQEANRTLEERVRVEGRESVTIEAGAVASEVSTIGEGLGVETQAVAASQSPRATSPHVELNLYMGVLEEKGGEEEPGEGHSVSIPPAGTLPKAGSVEPLIRDITTDAPPPPSAQGSNQ